MKIAFISIVIMLSACFISPALAQDGNSTLYNRLCKSWSIEKLEDNGIAQKADDAQKEYRLVFNSDSTMMQGLAPDGLIPGTWSLDFKTMTVTVKDSKTTGIYRMKIIKVSNDELILQTVDNDKSLVIYYKAS